MKIVVIGGSGLIGKQLIPLLRGRGHEAVYYGAALDDLGLGPRGANPRLGPTRFEQWVSRDGGR